jgi:hypothetical protein
VPANAPVYRSKEIAARRAAIEAQIPNHLLYEGNHAREVAARYATVATEVDLASDLHPAAHYFGK